MNRLSACEGEKDKERQRQREENEIENRMSLRTGANTLSF